MYEFTENKYILMLTRNGIIKKVKSSEFSNARQRGIIAINLDHEDKLISAKLTRGSEEIILITSQGHALRFHEKAVRPTGRNSRGVIGIKLTGENKVTGVLTVKKDLQMLVISQFGYGKRIEYDNFKAHGRGTKGQFCYKISKKSGHLVGALSVRKRDDIMCITSQGNVIKLKLRGVPVLGKAAFGVKIVNVEDPDYVVSIARVEK